MPAPLFVILVNILLKFTCIQVHIFVTRHLPRGHSISCPTHELERTIKISFTGLKGLRHVTTSRAVTHHSRVARHVTTSRAVTHHSRVVRHVTTSRAVTHHSRVARHVTTSRAVTYHSRVVRCSPRVPVFSRDI